MVEKFLIACGFLFAAYSSANAFPGNEGSDPWQYRPNDPKYGDHWHLFSHMPPNFQGVITDAERQMGSGMHVDRAWQLHTGRPDTLIAILDSGIVWDNEDLADRHFLNRKELPLPQGSAVYDANNDGRFSIRDYEHDSRVHDANQNGILDAGDLIRIFSDGIDSDGNGYTDDIAGWDFHENDNDPYDSIRFGHGTGEAIDSVAAVNNGLGGAGVCGDCSFVALRVNDSFVIDANPFAQAVIYATDLGADLVQQALGSGNNNPYVQDAIDYAYDHGMVIVGSAADENSFHHNFPSTLDPIIYTNAIRYDAREPQESSTFVAFNNCSNFGARVDVATSGLSCSSEATGNLSGITALALSYAKELGLDLTPGEAISLIKSTPVDIDLGPIFDPSDFRHPTYMGWDTMTGYGRTDAYRMLTALKHHRIPPEARIVSPQWFALEKKRNQGRVDVSVRVAPGGGQGSLYVSLKVARGVETSGARFISLYEGAKSGAWQGDLASVDHRTLAALPIQGRDAQRNRDAYTFVLTVTGENGLTAESRRTVFVIDDPDLLEGFPQTIGGSGEAAGLFHDINRDGKDEYIFGDGAGYIHAFRYDGSEVPGFPVATVPSLFSSANSHGMAQAYASLYAPVAVGDVDGDGYDDIVAVSMEGGVSAVDRHGQFLAGFPYVLPEPDMTVVNPQQVIARGIWAAPVLVNLDEDSGLEIAFGSLDGNFYVLDQGAQMLAGFPVAIEAQGVRAKLMSSPAVADLNDDGVLDFVLGSNHVGANAGTLFAVDGLGTLAVEPLMAGFPAIVPLIRDKVLPTVGTGIPTSPVIFDFDQDGELDILVHAFVGKTYIFGKNGLPKKSLSIQVGPGHETNDQYMLAAFGHPAVGDLTGDGRGNPVTVGVGKKMLVNMLLGGKRYPYDHMIGAWDYESSTMLATFPRRQDDMQLTGSPILVDLTGDGRDEIIAGSGGYYVRIFDPSQAGTLKRHFTGGWVFGAPSVGDMDGDGKLEIAATTREGNLFIWRTGAAKPTRMSWPTFKGNAARTGNVMEVTQ